MGRGQRFSQRNKQFNQPFESWTILHLPFFAFLFYQGNKMISYENICNTPWVSSGSSNRAVLDVFHWFLLTVLVIYWPSTEPSIKRCTCVNKLKNSGSRWTLENIITKCLSGSSQLETGCRSENKLQIEDFGPLVTLGWATQAKMQKKCC